MTLLATIFLAVLTRAEIIERMRAEPVTKQNGLVQVVANCPSDMRKEFQSPIAGFVSDICSTLYRHKRMNARRFHLPGIQVTLGDVRTNITTVTSRIKKRSDGSTVTRIFMPAPAFSDLSKLRCETVKAFYLAVFNETIESDERAIRLFRDADPELRAADAMNEINDWLNGRPTPNDDEYYIKKARSIMRPGIATEKDVLNFASRLMLYPEAFSEPFCGRFTSCSFNDAIKLAKEDLRIRLIAYVKSSQLILLGGGRGEELSNASQAYAKFLRELAAYKKSPDELKDMLEDANEKLNIALEEARNKKKGNSNEKQ